MALTNAVSVQGRIFIDRDPQHFGLILNFLRDGTCVLPMDGDARRQILQEADFYQLDSLRAFIMHEDRQELQTAHDLRSCIATRLEVPIVHTAMNLHQPVIEERLIDSRHGITPAGVIREGVAGVNRHGDFRPGFPVLASQ